MKPFDCLICGVGGQGVVLASKLIAAASMAQGCAVKTTDTIGMAQRGGSVVSHVRVGNAVHSPLIPYGTADCILAFEPAEAVRALPYLRQGGLMIVNTKTVMPVTASLGGGYDGKEMLTYLQRVCKRLCLVDGNAVCEKLGSARVTNITLLGAFAASGITGITLENIDAALQSEKLKKFYALNQQALALGAASGRNEKAL